MAHTCVHADMCEPAHGRLHRNGFGCDSNHYDDDDNTYNNNNDDDANDNNHNDNNNNNHSNNSNNNNNNDQNIYHKGKTAAHKRVWTDAISSCGVLHDAHVEEQKHSWCQRTTSANTLLVPTLPQDQHSFESALPLSQHTLWCQHLLGAGTPQCRHSLSANTLLVPTLS